MSDPAPATYDKNKKVDVVSPVEPKKKKRVIHVPTCPPAVSTAYLILRGAVSAVAGAACVADASNKTNGVAVASQCQAIYVKEANTGKFSVNLGKKLGDICELDLPETDEGIDHFLTAVESAANRIVQENHAIACFTAAKDSIANTYGDCCLDGSFKKTKGDKPLIVSFLSNTTMAVLPALPTEATGGIKEIRLDRTGCNVSASKKGRKADVTIKFLVIEHDNNIVVAKATVLPEIPDFVDTEPLKQPKIRCAEGHALQQAALVAAVQEKASIEQEVAPDSMEEEMVVNVEEVKGKIDYNKLVDHFGSTLIDADLLSKLEAETVGKGRVDKLHRFLRRGMFFSHRDLHKLLDAVNQGTPMYLYTGRGPSSESMHMGHLIPFLFTQWLQEAFDVPLVIQMTDDEKFIFKGEYDEENGDNLDHFSRLTIENARDIIACGFKKEKTFLFSDLDYVGRMYPNIVRIWKAVTTNTITGIFGFDGSSNIGKIAFPAVQAAPSFASSFPTVLQATRNSDRVCLIPCAIDQDPYFRLTRDVAHKLVNKTQKLAGKPALIHSKFFPPLQGATGKMSSSDTNSAIFLTDTPEEIERKITQHAFSGGQDTKAKQQELGADLEVDVSYQWLRFFLEDDEELERIGESYASGQGDYWSTGSVKARLIEICQELVAEHKERRATITDDEVRAWMAERNIV